MTTTYTTAAIVKKQVHNVAADLTDDDINEMINQAENMVDAAMKKSGINAPKDFTFDASKHGLIRMATTLIAAFLVMTSDVQQYNSSSFAGTQADLLWAQARSCLAYLSDSRVIDYLINL